MFPKNDFFICNKCGYKKKKDGSTIVVSKQRKKEVPVLEGKTDVLPKIRIGCPKCGHNEATWVLRQMRGSDEPETSFYTCTKCGYRWRS